MTEAAMPYPAPDPIPQRERWTETLHALAAQPLAFCPDFPRIAARHEAFWRGELDHPLFLGSINGQPQRPITRRLDLLDQPDAWLAAKLLDMQQTHRVGDALPFIRLDFGPVMLGGLLGADVDFTSDTTWTSAHINDDWSNAPDWTIHDDNPFWRYLNALARRLSEDARGRYLACAPDLGGSGDVLLNLRGSAALAMDVLDQPERIDAAIQAIYPAWRQGYVMLYDTLLSAGVGLINWHTLWSSEPYMIPACDFNALISPRSFRQLLLPDIARQAATAGRAIFHLDGPDAARHIDALLEVDDLHAIQYTPGAGTPQAMAKLDMLKKIQASGKSLLIMCMPDEVVGLCRELDPARLALFLEYIPDTATLDAAYAAYRRFYGVEP